MCNKQKRSQTFSEDQGFSIRVEKMASFISVFEGEEIEISLGYRSMGSAFPGILHEYAQGDVDRMIEFVVQFCPQYSFGRTVLQWSIPYEHVPYMQTGVLMSTEEFETIVYKILYETSLEYLEHAHTVWTADVYGFRASLIIILGVALYYEVEYICCQTRIRT